MASLTKHGRPNSCDYPTGSGTTRQPPDTKIPGKPIQKQGEGLKERKDQTKAQHRKKQKRREKKPVSGCQSQKLDHQFELNDSDPKQAHKLVY